MTDRLYYSSSASSGLPAPPGMTRRRLRDLYIDPRTRIPGSFRAPGRMGVLVPADDFDHWIRGQAGGAERSIDDQVLAVFRGSVGGAR